MNSEQLIEQIDYLIKRTNSASGIGVHAEATEFLRIYAGPRSSFHEQLNSTARWTDSVRNEAIVSILKGFRDYVQRGLNSGLSPERRAQIDVVSDFLDQAQLLLDDKAVHPAAPAVLVGASLEEFLRTWCDSAAVSIGNAKPGLDAYTKALRGAELITKQDAKDITAWTGLRNAAAHGEWKQLEDALRIRLMLEGVNLFMRKYSE